MLEYKLDCDENSNTNARTQVRAVGIEEIEEIKRKRDAGKKTTLAVLQRAVTSLLVDNPGRKFDLRVYVAVASWKPLVAFILPDSLVRLAYRPFTKGTKDKCATRTNTAQRKYCAVEDEDFATVTHNRTFETQNQSKSISLEHKIKQVHWKSRNTYGV